MEPAHFSRRISLRLIGDAHARFWWTGKLWHEQLNAPIYVPDEARHVLKILDERGADAFLQELERLSNLRCSWATAILANVILRCSVRRRANAAKVADLLRSHASSRDPYVYYMLAWAEVIAGHNASACRHMAFASKKGFPPAALDVISFVVLGIYAGKPGTRLIERLLARASASRHGAALAWRCSLYRAGRVGIVRAIIGVLLSPLAISKYWIHLRLSPFAATTYRFDPNATSPLFKGAHWEWRPL